MFGNTSTSTELDAPTEKIQYTRKKKQKQRNDAITDSGLRFDESVIVEEIHIEAPELKGDNADQYTVIDEHITYRLAQRPSSYVVLKYIQPVIKHKSTQVITTKSAPAAIFEKSMADVSFITGLIVDKFLYHLPLYRQHQKLQLSGITVSRSTLTNYVNRAGMLLKPLHEAVVRSILQSKVLALDETPVKAGRNKKGKKPQHIKAGNKPGTGHCWATRMKSLFHPLVRKQHIHVLLLTLAQLAHEKLLMSCCRIFRARWLPMATRFTKPMQKIMKQLSMLNAGCMHGVILSRPKKKSLCWLLMRWILSVRFINMTAPLKIKTWWIKQHRIIEQNTVSR